MLTILTIFSSPNKVNQYLTRKKLTERQSNYMNCNKKNLSFLIFNTGSGEKLSVQTKREWLFSLIITA